MKTKHTLLAVALTAVLAPATTLAKESLDSILAESEAPHQQAVPSVGTPPVSTVPSAGPVSGPSGGLSANAVANAEAASLITKEERVFAEQEERLLRDIRLAQLQKALTEERAAMAEAQRKMRGERKSQEPDAAAELALRTNPSIVDMPVRDPFTLVSVWGAPGNLRADFFYNGLRVTTKKGDILGDGWQVREIAGTSVTLQKGRQRKELALGRR